MIALNPWKNLDDLYSSEVMSNYRSGRAALTPHVFAVADSAFRSLATTGLSQSILVSGESGAGKTMTTRYLLQYLTGRDEARRSWIEQQVFDSNPILEAFGNATTLRNDNSSRFGRFIVLSYGAPHSGAGEPEIRSARIETYLLEKSRAVRPARGERNFHIFHQLLAAYRDPRRSSLPPCDSAVLPPTLALGPAGAPRFAVLGPPLADAGGGAAAAQKNSLSTHSVPRSHPVFPSLTLPL